MSGTPDPVDLHVGHTIRTLRKLKGLSQQALADAGGVTFQQVQKYERGANRVSASMLTRLAQALGVPAASLLPPEGDVDVQVWADVAELARTEGCIELARAYAQLDQLR